MCVFIYQYKSVSTHSKGTFTSILWTNLSFNPYCSPCMMTLLFLFCRCSRYGAFVASGSWSLERCQRTCLRDAWGRLLSYVPSPNSFVPREPSSGCFSSTVWLCYYCAHGFGMRNLASKNPRTLLHHYIQFAYMLADDVNLDDEDVQLIGW